MDEYLSWLLGWVRVLGLTERKQKSPTRKKVNPSFRCWLSPDIIQLR